MKLLRNFFVQALVFVATVLCMHSCSCDGDRSLEAKLKFISDDADFVVVVNLEKLMTEADITVEDDQLVLPDYLTKASSAIDKNMKKALNKVSDFKGLDFTQVVVAGWDIFDEGDYDPRTDKWVRGKARVMAIFNITDEDDFFKSVEAENSKATLEKDGDYKYVDMGGSYPRIYIKDKMAIMVEGKDDAEFIDERIEKAESKPLQEWKVKYLGNEENIATALIAGKAIDEVMGSEQSKTINRMLDAELSTVWVGIDASLKGPTLNASASVMDKEGKVLENKYAGVINTDLLKYVHPNDLLVVASGVKSMEGLSQVPDYMISSQLRPMVRALTGLTNVSTMMSFGPRTNQSISNFGPTSVRVTMALSANGSEVRDVYNYLCAWMEYVQVSMSSSYYMDEPVYGHQNDYPTTYSLTVPVGYSESMTINAELDGNTVIVSNETISRGGSVNYEASEFSGKALMVKGVLPKNLSQLKEFELPYGVVATLSMENTMKIDACVAMTGTDDKFLTALCNMISNFGK